MYIYDKQSEYIEITQTHKSLFSLYKTSEITKNRAKKRSLNRDLLNCLIGMVYIRWYLVHPHV